MPESNQVPTELTPKLNALLEKVTEFENIPKLRPDLQMKAAPVLVTEGIQLTSDLVTTVDHQARMIKELAQQLFALKRVVAAMQMGVDQ